MRGVIERWAGRQRTPAQKFERLLRDGAGCLCCSWPQPALSNRFHGFYFALIPSLFRNFLLSCVLRAPTTPGGNLYFCVRCFLKNGVGSENLFRTISLPQFLFVAVPLSALRETWAHKDSGSNTSSAPSVAQRFLEGRYKYVKNGGWI